MTSYTDKFDLGRQFAIADLALPADLEQQLCDALSSDDGPEITVAVDEAITAKIQEHGVTDEGDWLGDWSAADVVRNLLPVYAEVIVDEDIVVVFTPDGRIQADIDGYDHDTEDGSDNRPAVVAALRTLGWSPVPGAEWIHVEGGLGCEGGADRFPVERVSA